MFGPSWVKISLMTKHANYQYNVMTFWLKNVGATYQRMMKNIFL